MKKPPAEARNGVRFDRGAPGLQMDGEWFWVRQMTFRALRDFTAMVPEAVVEDSSEAVLEAFEANVPVIIHLLRNKHGAAPTADQVLDNVTLPMVREFVNFVFGVTE